LSFLKRWQKQELLELVQQITAASASLRDRQLDDSTRSAATTASERGETSDSEDEHLPTIVAAYSLGNAEDVLAHVKSGIIKDIMGPEDDQADEKLSLCTYLWVSFLRGAKYKSRDAKKREIEDWMKELFVPQKAHLYDEEIAEKVHGFLDHVVEHKLLEEIRGKTRAYPRVPCVGAVAIIDKVVEYLLLRQSKDAKRWGTWQDEVVGTWYSSGNQTPRAFLLRANKFLRRHVDKETELMTYVTTWSYVAFMRMTSLASLLLFEYLEARKLQEAFTPGAAGRNISPFHGFRTFVSSSKRVFALTEADAPDARAMPIVQQGLRCLSRLSASAWEMLGPEKKAHALYDEAIARELEKDDSMLKDGSKMPCDALWEPEGGWDAAFLKVVGMLTSEKGLPAPKPLDPQEVLMASKDMDLTAIKGKVQQGRYLRYPGEFHDDAVLVFRVQLDHCRGEELEQPQLQAKSHEDMADLKLRCEAIWTTIKGELQSVVIDKDANAPRSSSEHLIQLYRENLSVVTAYLEKLDEEVGYYNDSASGKRMRVEDESILLKAFWKDSIIGQCDNDSRAVDEDMICPTTQRLMVDPVKCLVDVEDDVFTCAYERSGIERWKQTQVQLWKQKQSHKELTITCPMRWPPKTIFQDGEYKLVMVQDEEMLKRIKELQSEKMANEARRKQEIEGREEHIMMRSGTRAGRIVRANGPRNPAAA
jgi:hypothetical protein